MNTSLLARHDARIVAAMLVATLAALLAVFALAKPSGAQDAQIIVEPVTVGFGADEVDGSATIQESSVTITNNTGADVVIGGLNGDINLSDLTGDFDVLSEVRDALTGVPLPGDLTTGVTLGDGETAELQLTFTASAQGTREAVLELTDNAGNLIQNVDLTGTGITVDPSTQPGVTPDDRRAGCTKFGTPGNDTLTGTAGRDVICALSGNDKIKALGGKDVTRAGPGKDRATDKSGLRDKLLGQKGNDTLNAKDRNRDLLNGASGRDKCAKNRGDKVRSC
jgi:Ca2+-binding RTX toxin-like protein